ncbi:MAG: hypothetical protein ACXWNR_06705 [Candidatus Limnocylindrales bacterium]
MPALGLVTAAAALIVAIVSSPASGSPMPAPSSPGEPGLASPTPAFQLGIVPGNSAGAPLPTDAPPGLIPLPQLPSCGAEVLFEQDVDISPVPTAPGPVTDATANQQATDCLLSAWENGRAAVLVTSAISDEADEIYSIYRLPGDGTVDVIVRVRSHSDQTVSWTERTCRQLSVQQGAVTPADCDPEAPMN